MTLAGFDEVYLCYDGLARHCFGNTMAAQRGVEYQEFPWQPYKLIQAYALGVRALEERSIVCTPTWKRQEGATTTACALMLTSEDVVVLTSDLAMAKYTSRLVTSMLEKNGWPHAGSSVVHDRVWWMSGLEICARGQPRPKLVVVDSDTAYTKPYNRVEAIDFVHRWLDSAVLVLDGPQPLYI